jgi:hypothetical protein
MQGFKAALKAEPNADLDDVNVALGSTEPTVSAPQRDAAESARRARVDKANEQFDRDPANQAYAAAVQAARVAYATHRNKQKYTAEIQQARDARKNSPEMQQRDAAIAAADAQYNKDIQDARAKNLVPVRRAQQQAQLRLEANSPETAKVIADFRVAIDSLSAQLSAELGQANPLSAIVDQNLGVYLTRSYKIHQDKITCLANIRLNHLLRFLNTLKHNNGQRQVLMLAKKNLQSVSQFKLGHSDQSLSFYNLIDDGCFKKWILKLFFSKKMCSFKNLNSKKKPNVS